MRGSPLLLLNPFKIIIVHHPSFTLYLFSSKSVRSANYFSCTVNYDLGSSLGGSSHLFAPIQPLLEFTTLAFLTNKSRLAGAVDHLFILTSCVLSSKKVDKNTHCSKNIARKDKTLVLPNHIMKHLTLSKNSVESNLESLTEIAMLWVPFLFRSSQLHKQARLSEIAVTCFHSQMREAEWRWRVGVI